MNIYTLTIWNDNGFLINCADLNDAINEAKKFILDGWNIQKIINEKNEVVYKFC